MKVIGCGMLVGLIAALGTAATTVREERVVFQTGSRDEVNAAVMTRDGKRVYSLSLSGEITVWDTASQKAIGVMENPVAGSVPYFALSPDERFLFVARSGGFPVTTSVSVFNLDRHTVMSHAKFSGHFVGMDPDGRHCYTVSPTHRAIVRGDITTGAIIETVQPIRHEGLKFAVCSPDGVTIAMMTLDQEFMLLDVKTRQVRRITEMDSVKDICQVAFSGDGRRLALINQRMLYVVECRSGAVTTIASVTPFLWSQVTSSGTLQFARDGDSICVATTESIDTFSLVARRRTATLPNTWVAQRGFRTNSTRIRLSPDNRSLLVGIDRTVFQLSWPTGEVMRAFEGLLDPQTAVAISHNGRWMASAGDSEQFVRIWDLSSASLRRSLAARMVTPGEVLFSPDDRYLVVAARPTIIYDLERDRMVSVIDRGVRFSAAAFFPDSSRFVLGSAEGRVSILETATGKEQQVFLAHGNTIESVDVSPDGRFIASCAITRAAKGDARLWDASGKSVRELNIAPSVTADRVFFSADSKAVFVQINNAKIMKFSIDDGALLNTLDCKVARIGLAPDRRTAVLGIRQADGTQHLVRHDLANLREVSRMPVGSVFSAFDMVIHPSGDRIAVPCDDGVTRMISLADGSVISFCGDADGRDWLVYSDSGFWDGSAASGRLVAVLRRDEVFNIDQFATAYNRPDRVIAALPVPDKRFIDYFAAQHVRRVRRMELTDVPVGYESPPEITGLVVQQKGALAQVSFSITPGADAVRRYHIYVNGVPVFGSAGVPWKGGGVRETVGLVPVDNMIEVSCTTEHGIESGRALTRLRYNGAVQGSLYFLGIGVSRYRDSALNLQFAEKDVRDLAAVFSAMKGYRAVHVKTITDEAATVAGVRTAREFFTNARPEDTAIVAIAGHGMHDADAQATYYFLTHETDLQALPSTAADFTIIEDLLQGIAPRSKILLMDTCESGEIEENREKQYWDFAAGKGIIPRTARAIGVVKRKNRTGGRSFLSDTNRFIFNDLVRRSGAVVFSSCRGDEYSYEDEKSGNGFFTRAVMNALRGYADTDRNRRVSLDELRQYVASDVASRTESQQHPVIDRDNIHNRPDFPYADGRSQAR